MLSPPPPPWPATALASPPRECRVQAWTPDPTAQDSIQRSGPTQPPPPRLEEGTGEGEGDPPPSPRASRAPADNANSRGGRPRRAPRSPCGRRAAGSLSPAPPNREERRSPAAAIPASRVAMPAASSGGGVAAGGEGRCGCYGLGGGAARVARVGERHWAIADKIAKLYIAALLSSHYPCVLSSALQVLLIHLVAVDVVIESIFYLSASYSSGVRWLDRICSNACNCLTSSA